MKILIYLLGILSAEIAEAAFISHTDVFDADKCVNGIGGTWNGACVCYHLNKQGGRYCNTAPEKACKKNTDCPAGSYCHFISKVNGFCYKAYGYGPVSAENIAFVLSDSIGDRNTADSFCSILGEGWETASRADFNCASLGPGCLNTDLFGIIKKKLHTRGFFWLERDLSLPEDQAYYADLMDGTVYRTQSGNHSTMQALCIYKTQK